MTTSTGRWLGPAPGLALAAVMGCGLSAPALAQDPAGDGIRIGVVLKTLANPFWLSMQEGIDAKAAEVGATVTAQAAMDEAAIDEQTTMLQTMVGQDFDCLIVAPISNTNLIQPLVTAAQNGTPIVALDAFDEAALAAAGVELATYISVRHTDAGQSVAEDMGQRLGREGKVALIGGLAGHPASVQRLQGFREAAGSLEVVQEQAADWDREKALNAADAILRANPDLVGIYAANDGMALGVQQAVQNAGLGDQVLVYGTDAVPDALASIQAGQLTGTSAQFPFLMGQMGVEACLAASQGMTLEALTVAPQGLISAENVEAAQEAAPSPWFEFDSPIPVAAE